MEKITILWADDEMDLLKPHILFLQEKGYKVDVTNNGNEALEKINENYYDIVFLDENMPGMSGLEVLTAIKALYPNLPVVMITKNEAESIMDDAIGSSISDYLIKPVNPNQILLSLKKNLENKKLISEKTTSVYQQEFRNISLALSNRLNHSDWINIYKKLVYWEIELEKSSDSGMQEILISQKTEANKMFSKFIEANYIDWVKGKSQSKPILSHTAFKEKVIPFLKLEESVFLIVIDNFRYDQWKILQPIFENYYRVEEDDIFYSILPTATQYARNAFFAGLMPTEIEKKYPMLWLDEDEEGTKNQHEAELISEQLKRWGVDIKHSYNKVLNLSYGKKVLDYLPNLISNKLNVIVYNFVDMLSHSRTDMEVLRELAEDESAYRSLTLSWFEHSTLIEVIKYLSSKKARIILTTDHGSIKVSNASKVLGDKNTNTNLRYKIGKSLQYSKKDVFEILNPADAFLPKLDVSSTYIFAKENTFFAYPNNYNYYASFYKNTFQHGGVSMEEILIPFINLIPK
jgi:DNA-binding response OmpR family regulator